MLMNSVQNSILLRDLSVHFLQSHLWVGKTAQEAEFCMDAISPLFLRLYNLHLPILFSATKAVSIQKCLTVHLRRNRFCIPSEHRMTGMFMNRCSSVSTGSSWIVLTADSEGFVPLTFTSMQEVVVRDASMKGYSARSSKTLDIISSTEGCRHSASESLDITSSLEVLRDCSSKALDGSSPSEQPSSKM